MVSTGKSIRFDPQGKTMYRCNGCFDYFDEIDKHTYLCKKCLDHMDFTLDEVLCIVEALECFEGVGIFGKDGVELFSEDTIQDILEKFEPLLESTVRQKNKEEEGKKAEKESLYD